MYCPKCGESNSDETRFCRSCGENLKVISQVMTRRLPVALASKLDAYIERKNERLRRDGIGSAVIGICFALLGGYELINGAVFLGNAGIMLLFACFMFLVSVWDMMAYKRSLDMKLESADNLSILPDNKILPENHIKVAPPSVTDATTRSLDMKTNRLKN